MTRLHVKSPEGIMARANVKHASARSSTSSPLINCVGSYTLSDREAVEKEEAHLWQDLFDDSFTPFRHAEFQAEVCEQHNSDPVLVIALHELSLPNRVKKGFYGGVRLSDCLRGSSAGRLVIEIVCVPGGR